MIRRFQIEDLISQNEHGVVFRALDTETGKFVALHRFFPFGASGGGLQPEEQGPYNVAVARLAGLSHPALRSIICGGCDPVDGMPFIATEWIDGDPLGSFLEHGPLPAETATELITQALEVCELLSHVLAEDAVWVETDLQTIIVGNPQSGRGFTFWICPLKWLGSEEKSRGLDTIVALTEVVMGWQGRKLNDQAGHGLAGWVKWLKHAENTISLNEARETLAASVGVPPPPPTQKLVAQATRPPPPPPTRVIKPPSSNITPWLVNISLALVAVGLGGWYLVRQRDLQSILSPVAAPEASQPASPQPAPAAPKPADSDTRPQPTAQALEATISQQKFAALQNDGAIHWTSRDLLLHNDKEEVVVEGVLEEIGFSEKKTRMYLLFSKHPEKNDARGVVLLKSAPEDFSAEVLKPIIGKRVRLHGTVETLKLGGLQRPEIVLKDRASIHELE